MILSALVSMLVLIAHVAHSEDLLLSEVKRMEVEKDDLGLRILARKYMRRKISKKQWSQRQRKHTKTYRKTMQESRRRI